MKLTLYDRYLGTMYGLAFGDALGAPVEFMKRGTFKPVTGMRGGGTFKLKPGEWTDDTSMALCLAESLALCEDNVIEDQLQRYWDWYSTGYMSSNGRCFDIGIGTSMSLKEWHRTGRPSPNDSPDLAGNGALMRMAPVVLMYQGVSPESTIHNAVRSSKATHAADEAVQCSMILAVHLYYALRGQMPDPIPLLGDRSVVSERVQSIMEGGYASKTISQISSSGYCCDTLEAALWCLINSDSFEEAVLMAVNLGDDADTVGAVTGQLAGAYYGASQIPERWIKQLAKLDLITHLTQSLFTLRKR